MTAATPMVEDAQKSFLSDTIQEEDEESEGDAQPTVCNGERKRTSELEHDVAEAVDEILEEACKETSNKQVSQPPPMPPPPAPPAAAKGM